jgi:hypothetical protein
VCGPPICSRSLVPSRELPREPGKPPLATFLLVQRREFRRHRSTLAIPHRCPSYPASPKLTHSGLLNSTHPWSTRRRVSTGHLSPPQGSTCKASSWSIAATSRRPSNGPRGVLSQPCRRYSALSSVEWSLHDQQLVAPSPLLHSSSTHQHPHHGLYRPLPPARPQ